jgi:tetratricopeptide (TPR) repeat protein
MKKAILFWFGVALFTAGAIAGIQEDFTAANRLYEEGRYAGALDLYLKVDRQARDWQVPYNIGNCYYKMGRYLSAKVYYLKARKLRPLEASIARNIAMTNRQFRDDATPPGTDFITRTFQRLESKLTMNALSLLLLLAVLLFNVFLFLLLTRGRSKKLIYALSLSLFLALLAGAYHISRTAAMGRSNEAVVWEEGSQLRSGPGEDNTALFTVNPGLEVRIIDRYRDWVQVTASERIAGWIEKKKLVLI